MMVVLVIFTLVIGIAFTAISLNDISQRNVNAQIDLYNKNKQLHNAMAEELRLSTLSRFNTVNAPCAPNAPCFQIYIDTDSDYNIEWGAEGVVNNWIHYELAGAEVVRQVLDPAFSLVSGSQRVLADNVTALSFNLGANPVIINSTVRKRAIENVTLSSQSRVYLRNE
jgi:hypothetical protein